MIDKSILLLKLVKTFITLNNLLFISRSLQYLNNV
uniref:Uncharacterized protein n=1 Tax=Rhizophora mucronata TaxID=61149 RepID=A0A2P2PTM0_RHIMU